MSFKRIIYLAIFFCSSLACQEVQINEMELSDVQSDSITVKPVVNGDARIDFYLPYLRGKRVALVVNHTSVVGGKHLCDTLRSRGVDIVRVFTPEHGFRGNADAGAAINGNQNVTDFDVVSLYGKNKKPTPEQMNGIDVVLYDLQDVGVRFYTYISTMHYVMEASAEKGVPFVVLDRPNPNGDYVAGPILEADCKSFVGMHPIPIVYGLTAGELAYMINGEGWLEKGLHCDLKVVEVENYSHSMRLSLEIFPSPNLKSDHAVRLYPSLCLFEGSSVSVGRGTPDPFTILGAPDTSLGDYSFVPQSIEGAQNPMHLGKTCYGDDLRQVPDTTFTIKYLLKYYKMMGEKFWGNTRSFDILAGTTKLRAQIKQGLTEDSIVSTWQPALNKYRAMRDKYLIYDSTDRQTHWQPIDWQSAMYSAEVDSMYGKMSVDERIAQLIWIYLNKDTDTEGLSKLLREVGQYKVGGVLFLKNTPMAVKTIINDVKSKSVTPLFFAVDGENGLAMKFENTIMLPKNMSIGAIADTTLVERFGEYVGRQLRSCGININFAPVVDVNTNSANPIIGMRSFGENAHRVARCATAYVRGMQRCGVVAVAKHFPGHGDTSTDSHTSLPVIACDTMRLDSVELLPFRRCIDEGVMGVMSAHISVPALDDSGMPASLSPKILDGLLRGKLSFDGLIVTDGINMAGIQNVTKGKNAEAEALAVGNDVVEFSIKIREAINAAKQKLVKNEIDTAVFEKSVRRVLAAKLWCGANLQPQDFRYDIDAANIADELLAKQLFEASVTALKSDGLDTVQFAEYKYFGSWKKLVSSPTAKKTESVKNICVFVDDSSIGEFNAYLQTSKPLTVQNTKLTVVFAGNPYKISKLKSANKYASFVVAYEKNNQAKQALLDYISFGGSATGRLPVSVAPFAEGDGIDVVRK